MKKVENGTTTYYLRSTLLGGQIVAELNGSGSVTRGFVYLGGQLLAVQQNNQVSWVHQDPVAKSKRVTNSAGTVVSTIELDPWGGDTNRSNNEAFQPRRFTTYDRDGNSSDEAMHRRYNRWHSRFDQPDPYGGSYDVMNPQSFNRYSFVQNDPVNFVDPTGLDDDCRDEQGNPVDCGPPIDPEDVVRIYTWDWAYLPFSYTINWLAIATDGGGEGGNIDDVGSTLPERIKQKICSVIPSGRTVGVSGGLGLVGGPVGGGEIVINYNSGQMSAFAFGGTQVGWIGGAQGSAYTGFVYGLNNSNSNYSGGFTGGSGAKGLGGFAQSSSGGLTGGPIPNGEVKAGGVSVGGSLLGGFSAGASATHYTKPLQLFKNPLGLGAIDPPLYVARQVCK